MTIVPLHDRILVKLIKSPEVTKGGIIIPDIAKEKPLEGIVVAVGNGKVLDSGLTLKPGLQVGDKIYFGKYAGFEMSINDEEHIMMRDCDVLCKLDYKPGLYGGQE